MTDEQKRERIEMLYAKYQRKFSDVKSITAAELQAIRQDEREFVIVDVRNPEEQAVSMIPGAITSGEFDERHEEFRGDLVVTYCTAGYRSGLYAQRLESQGWEVVNLAGSLLAYTHAGLPLVDKNGSTNRIHVYGPDWNLAAEGYVPVW